MTETGDVPEDVGRGLRTPPQGECGHVAQSAGSGDPAPQPSHRRRNVERALVVAALAAVFWFFHWTVAVNGGFEDWGDQDFYRLLVRGWMKGQLAIDKEPASALLALADPYDPAQNGAHRLADASYFRGKYYLYFGAAPALTLMLPWRLLTGQEMTMGMAVFAFAVVAFLVAGGLWLSLRRRYFPQSAVFVAPLGVLALGFGTHLLALLQRPAFWELPIVAGIAFTLLALVATYRAMHGTRPRRAMAAAGFFLGLAVASRPTCLFAAPLLLAPLWLAWRRKDEANPWWRLALAAALPLGACGLALMAHNYARFGSVLEFGQNYQLSGAFEGKLTHFSPRFIAHNFAVYFFQPVQWSWTFPFVAAQGIPVSISGYFGTEEVCGIAVTLVFAWFVLGVPLMTSGRVGDEKRALQAPLLAVGGALLPVMTLLLCYFSTTARYQPDFAVTLGLLAAGGLLGIERVAQRRRGGGLAVVVLATLLTGATVVMGALLSFDYHGGAFARNAPPVWAQLEQRAQSALGRVGLWLGQFNGPQVLKVRLQPHPAGRREILWQPTDARADERIVVEHLGEHLIRFGYERSSDAPVWGRPLKWETDHTHTVELQVPSLHGSPRGWMRGLRRGIEYRERSGVAVWFSGGRALDAIVAPWPGDLRPGGEVGRPFSGEVRSRSTRLFRGDEVREEVRRPAGEPPGGVLRLTMVVPDTLAPEGEPLFAAGAHYQSDMVFVRPSPGGFVFVFDHYGSPQTVSAVLPLFSARCVVEIALPSCARGENNFGEATTGDVVIRSDGREVLRSRQTCHAFSPGSELIGRNLFGTTCAPEFRGWLLEARWVAR